MKVLILAAGYGTRLKEIAKDLPKPLLPVNDKPLMEYIIERVEHINELNEIIVVTNNKFYSQFNDWAQSMRYDVPINVINDGSNSPEERLGSIGDIHFALKHAGIDEDLLIVGGDNLFDFDLKSYSEFAQVHRDSVTIGVFDIHNLEEAKLFGVVALDESQKITSFEEKPLRPKSSLIAMCFYYLPHTTFELMDNYLNSTEKTDKAGDYIKWLCQKIDVYGFKFSGKWYDIGSIEAYQDAQQNFR
ncbi:MAG: nucleotidyltransferase family protein [Candidatus Omnitrophica bacterium]|nr:nucleotidyltransferase family protein [Candidatus Omnitrophota bacterium]